MKQIDKIVKGIVEPKDINVLWLDTNDPKSPTLKAYADGEWKAISSGEGGGGGSAEGAVSYEPQELTDEQKMQARENQGLYASKSVDSTFVTFTAKEAPTEYDDAITVNDISSGNEDVWVKVGDCDRVPITSPYKVTLQKDGVKDESFLDSQYSEIDDSGVEYTKDAVMSEGLCEGSLWDGYFLIAFLNNPSSVYPLKEFAGKKGVYCDFTNFLSKLPTGTSLSIELLPTISYDGNYADKDYLEFTLPLEVDGGEVLATLRLIKVADGPIDMFDRSVTEEFDGESFTYSGAIYIPNDDSCFALSSENIHQVSVGHCLFGDNAEEFGFPILVSGDALAAGEENSGEQFFIFSNAVISGTDSNPRTGIYVVSNEYDSVGYVDISPITEISYLPYEEIYNKIDPKYIDGEVSSGGVFEVEFTYGNSNNSGDEPPTRESTASWHCNHTFEEIIDAINAGKIIRAVRYDSYDGTSVTTDFILEDAVI